MLKSGSLAKLKKIIPRKIMPDNLNYRVFMKYNDEMKKLVQANEREPFRQGQMEEEKVYAVKKKIFRGNKIVLNQTGVKKNEIAQ